jgi:hypothetical protein
VSAEAAAAAGLNGFSGVMAGREMGWQIVGAPTRCADTSTRDGGKRVNRSEALRAVIPALPQAAANPFAPSFPRRRESMSACLPLRSLDSRLRGNDGADVFGLRGPDGTDAVFITKVGTGSSFPRRRESMFACWSLHSLDSRPRGNDGADVFGLRGPDGTDAVFITKVGIGSSFPRRRESMFACWSLRSLDSRLRGNDGADVLVCAGMTFPPCGCWRSFLG